MLRVTYLCFSLLSVGKESSVSDHSVADRNSGKNRLSNQFSVLRQFPIEVASRMSDASVLISFQEWVRGRACISEKISNVEDNCGEIYR